MNSICLKGFLDCTDSSKLSTERNSKCQKQETLLRSGLLILSFAVFSFLIGPQLQSSLPRNESIAVATQSRQVNIRPSPSARDRFDREKATKAVMVLGLLTASHKN